MRSECRPAKSYSKWQPTAMAPVTAAKGNGSWAFFTTLSALVLYAGFALLWVWILSFTPLSRAYPFVALAFALTPLLAGSLFGETISLRLIVGLLLIVCGLFFISA